MAFVVQWGLHWFDVYTELTPDHADLLSLCFIAAISVGLLSLLVGFFQTSGSVVARLALAISWFGLIGFLSTFLLFDVLTRIALNYIDFPKQETHTFKALLPIGRSYRTYARFHGYGWTIQPTPLWSNIDIEEADYNFMLAHRRPDDLGRNAEEIPSRGFFCAKVTMQRAGDALRVMHAGSEKLPGGSIAFCPSVAAGQPYLEIPN